MPQTTRRTTRIPALTATLTAALAAATLSAAPTASASDTAPAKTGDSTAVRADIEALAAAGAVGVVAAVSGDTLSWSGGAGVRSLTTGAQAKYGDTARVASVTKSMVSTLALQEVQAGRWTLSTTVGEVLPGLLPGHDGVTLEQLLSHRSGLPDYDTTLVAGATSPEAFLEIIRSTYTDSQLVGVALTQPWMFEPGSDFGYSNTNYIVVGLMLQKLNGKPVGTLLQRRVFGPAGMDTATFQTSAAWGTRKHLTEYALVGEPIDIDDASPSVFSSAGAVEASPRDLDKFYRALITGKLLSPGLVTQMATPRTQTPLAYGLGIYAVGDPCPGPDGEQQALFGHDGLSFGTQTLAFTSADGTRQAALSWTGREYVNPTPAQAELANTFLIDAFSANCSTTAPAPSTKAAPQTPNSTLPALPSLWSATRADVPLARVAG